MSTSRTLVGDISEVDTEDEIDTLSRRPLKRKKRSNVPDSSHVKVVATAQGKTGSLEWILSSDKSPLCSVSLKKVINEVTWVCLSEEDRKILSSLLPPTIQSGYKPALPWYHPSKGTVDVDAQSIEPQPGTADVFEAETGLFMNLPSFESALVTFQDQLYSGWLTTKHRNDVEKFSNGINSGEAHAPWKDEAWEIEQRREDEEGRRKRDDRPNLAKMHQLDIIRSSDILNYRRHFPEQGVFIEKDLLVEGRWTHGLSVITPGGQESGLPLGMLMSNPVPPPGTPLQQMHIQSPEELEQAILDIDGRIPRENRRKVDSWKRFSLWRLLPELQFAGDPWDMGFGSMGVRGPREKRGTLFYLRGAF
ncbi:hypothetical protein FRC14_007136 [Serendipita sp. 396]|nr:hypothetical protein FRC14_007136 [Serendipita sp. 396]KAG8778438.1 hypothetical protein FRC15_010798 [Serendipita sp. 397]KAG9044736.1 hypothetical protein FS842_001409 [Serendipita sp. 407]